MASIYTLPETYCPTLDALTSEEVIQLAISNLTSRKEILAASIATLQKRLRHIRCMSQEVSQEEYQRMKLLKESSTHWDEPLPLREVCWP
jgi:hypothetical protein